MKINTERQRFQHITVIIETADEAAAIREALARALRGYDHAKDAGFDGSTERERMRVLDDAMFELYKACKSS